MKQGELFLNVCGTLNTTSSSDVDSTVNTSTESIGQTHTNCSKCNTELNLDNWMPSFAKRNQRICNTCYKDKFNTKNSRLTNPLQMYVNGKYISRKHPLYKAGHYKTWDDVHSHGVLETVKEGEVYIITNPAWPEWVKIGMAIDAKDRCKGYQTSSPMRDYKVMYSVYSKDRRKTEAEAHRSAEVIADRRGEWFKMSVGEAKECIQHGL